MLIQTQKPKEKTVWELPVLESYCAILYYCDAFYQICQHMFGGTRFSMLYQAPLLDCHVLEGCGIYMIGILDSYLICGRLVSPACGSLIM